MPIEIQFCPQCQTSVSSQARYCQHCGADLAFYALQAERQVLSQSSSATLVPHVPIQLVPRLGMYLLRNELITKEYLNDALEYQKKQKALGVDVLLGQALVDLNYISRTTLDRAITEQLLELQAALQQSNRILEQRVAERTADLKQALNKLKELNQLKINFISNISHELLTPLAKIKGFGAMLADSALGDINPEQRSALHTVNHAVDTLEHLIKDLIRFASTARGEIRLDYSPVDFLSIANRLCDTFSTKANQGRVTLNQKIPKSLQKIRADGEKLSWVLYQLLDNAIKFTPPNGQVTIGANAGTQYATIYVQDTGIGIPPERLSETFVPFHQLDGSSTRHYSGTGLGLALVYRLLEVHGSKLRVESKVNVGSTFLFDLPYANLATPNAR
jgi:signal transduction histidine kinase